jgi:hypothetical protein
MPLPTNKRLQAQIPPNSLASALHGTRDPERSVLVRYNVILVFRVRRLVLRRDVDVLDW